MNTITLYHGTIEKKLDSILSTGIERNARLGAQWYMLATDFASALFHASPDRDEEAIVVEVKVPIEPTHSGMFSHTPHLWNPHRRNENSEWLALFKDIPAKHIQCVHRVSHADFLAQKLAGMDKTVYEPDRLDISETPTSKRLKNKRST
jgi:RNA:NAD 2'-phosphotransferase (TPT1/KptA family)